MENENQVPPSILAFKLLSGMMNSMVVSALIITNVIETLGQQQKSTEEIAECCQLNQNVLSRTLRFASLARLVVLSDGKYGLTDVGRCFLKDVPGSLFGFASFIKAPPWRDSWMQFSHCLITGQTAFDHVFGQSFFDFLDSNEEYGKPFNQHMTRMTAMIVPAVADAYDFSVFGTICDVGGGQGILLNAILEKSPHSKGILFDMENAMKEHVLTRHLTRVSIMSGSFFEKIPPADCMLLKTIIHDWNDENCRKILTNYRQALNPGGKLLLIEQVIQEPYTEIGLFYDLHMQVILGGNERTEDEFIELLDRSGLKPIRFIPTRSPFSIIEASL